MNELVWTSQFTFFLLDLSSSEKGMKGGLKPWPALLCGLSNQANYELLISIRSSNTWNLCITYTVVIVVWKYDALRLNNLYWVGMVIKWKPAMISRTSFMFRKYIGIDCAESSKKTFQLIEGYSVVSRFAHRDCFHLCPVLKLIRRAIPSARFSQRSFSGRLRNQCFKFHSVAWIRY